MRKPKRPTKRVMKPRPFLPNTGDPDGEFETFVPAELEDWMIGGGVK